MATGLGLAVNAVAASVSSVTERMQKNGRKTFG